MILKKGYLLFTIISLIACSILIRFSFGSINDSANCKITTWDALGYYMYLPAILKYQECSKLDWFTSIEEKYQLTGGQFYQARKAENGNFVFKYYGGVALMQLPFYLIADWHAKISKYPADGFSYPYQFWMAWAPIFYFILALLVLSKTLLNFFKEPVVILSLIAVVLATNLLQYVSVDGGQSHAFIFLLYALIIYYSHKWHLVPNVKTAAIIGAIIGLACLCRPTEIVMMFIPLFWATHNKTQAKEKWAKVKLNKSHLLALILSSFVMLLPQMVYWYIQTGSAIFDVGSKWDFASPHFRVLLGWEKGWFIYTPVTLLMIAGFFKMQSFPFKKSFAIFAFLNIYIIIAWHDWRYGGSYSARALVQSLPVFVFGLAALLTAIRTKYWFYAMTGLIVALSAINLFQINQYNKGIIHYNDMNRSYYQSIFLDVDPEIREMSLLDNKDFVKDEKKYTSDTLIKSLVKREISGTLIIHDSLFAALKGERFLKYKFKLKSPSDYWSTKLYSIIESEGIKDTIQLRLNHPMTQWSESNPYEFYHRLPLTDNQLDFQLQASNANFKAELESVIVNKLSK